LLSNIVTIFFIFKIKIMRDFLLLILFFTVLNVQGQGQEEGTLEPFLEPSQHLEQMLDVDKLKEMEEEIAGDWDEDYRTSDEEEERGTGFSFDVNHPPKDAVRVGCECMDGTTMDLKGGGACAGYGGVRYWIYEEAEGKRSMYPTERHYEHPAPLSEEELSSLVAHNKPIKYGDSYNSPIGFRLGWLELLGVIIICVTIAFVTKTLWGTGQTRENQNKDELYR
jgi:hypothetical protein